MSLRTKIFPVAKLTYGNIFAAHKHNALCNKSENIHRLACFSHGADLKRRAFTLVELLTVMAIIGVLSAILIPSVGAVMRRVRQSQCAGNLREMYIATRNYAADNNNRLPVGHGNRVPGCETLVDWFRAFYFYLYGSGLQPKKGAQTMAVYQALQDIGKNMHRSDSLFVCPDDEDPTLLGSTKGEEYNCWSYKAPVELIFSTYNEYMIDPRTPRYGRDMDDPRLRGGMILYADSGKTNELRPIRGTNGWTPNRHGGTPPPDNDGARNPHGKNNIVFLDGHVEALTREEIPVGTDSDAARRFWAPPRENGE